MPFTHTALYGPCTLARMVEVGISAGRTNRISPSGVLRPPQISRMVCFSALAYWKSSGVMRRMPSTKMSDAVIFSPKAAQAGAEEVADDAARLLAAANRAHNVGLCCINIGGDTPDHNVLAALGVAQRFTPC